MAAGVAVLALVTSAPAHAIPSPEVVVSFFSNTAQIFGLLTLAVGGTVFSRRRLATRLRGRHGQGRRRAVPGSLLACIVILLVASAGANLLQWSSYEDARIERLSANLVRSSQENGKPVGDVSLKTLEFSEQAEHPQGLPTDYLERVLRAGGTDPETDERVNLIDVRESEEWETGRLHGFKHTRYPDVLAQLEALQVTGRRNVLLCHSGNRSSELCEILAAKGIDCRFVVGGYEKWLAEERPVAWPAGAPERERRGIPPFPNDDVLLDTADVHRLVDEEQAIFIDVRYPAEFERGHLPGARNMTLRAMTSAELESAFAELPERPVVAPCYDKRSCFYAQILGLRLSRLGHDFRGRYTVPHEYLAAGQLPYAEGLLATDENSLLGLARQPAVVLLSWLRDRLGSVILAIFAVIALLRLVMLPLTIKGERDQIVLRRVDGRIRELKERHAGDPRRLKFEIHCLYRANRLTPGRNVVVLIAQILFLLVLFSAIAVIAPEGSGRFLWIADIGAADPLFLLPVLLGGLVYLQLEIGAARRSAKFAALRLLGGVAFGALTATLPAALVLYLIFGLVLMLVQVLAVRAAMARKVRKESERLPPRVSSLALAHRIPGAGRKAQRLGRLVQAGLPVPPGLVIPHAAFLTGAKATRLSPDAAKDLARLSRRLKLRKTAVRSSGVSEDGGSHSYAGVFDTVLNVEREGLIDAIAQVRQSFESGAAAAYGDGDRTGGVIVQAMIEAEYAGILFTEHPADSGTLLVEMTEGVADSLASGMENAQSYAFGRVSGQFRGTVEPPIELKPLIALAMRIEALFGRPQDVEWAYRRGRFYILQARDITAMERVNPTATDKGFFERERHRLLQLADSCNPGDTVLMQNELSELLPRPTPLSVSFMDELWKPGGSVHLACDALGVPYDASYGGQPLVTSVFGSLYVNAQELQRRTRKRIGAIASFRLSRAAESIEREFREQFLPSYLSELRLLEAMDFGRLPTGDLIDLFEDTSERYLHETHVQVDIINIAADFYVKAAERAMRKHGMNSGVVLGQGAPTVMHQAMDLLQQLRQGRATPEEFLTVFGHRSTVDYELSLPRYREDISMMESLIRSAGSLSGGRAVAKEAEKQRSDGTLALVISRAHRFQALKEEAKHHSLREFAALRRILVELDRRLSLDGGIFFLEFGELAGLRHPSQIESLQALIAERRAAARYFGEMSPLGATVTLHDLETMGMSGGGEPDGEDTDGDLQGCLVAGSESVVGRARVLSGEDIRSVGKGEIVVARYMHPSWTPVFPRLKGIVTEVGGWLSHTSILAREYNLTTIIGVKAAEYRVRTGDLLRLNLDGTVEVLERVETNDRAAKGQSADDGGVSPESAGRPPAPFRLGA